MFEFLMLSFIIFKIGEKFNDIVCDSVIDAKGGLIFAQYYSKGDHRARFDPLGDVHIDFLKDSFKITEP